MRKNIFSENKDFYPTPDNLIIKMWSKIDTDRKGNGYSPLYVLEPSAGDGRIAQYVSKRNRSKVKCIENDENLRNMLIGAGHHVIDEDFLLYEGHEFFDAIIMNPPFSEGEHHLLKAIDIMFNGQIVCLLNAETIKNPYSVYRQALVNKLEELKADIEYIEGSFELADRKTSVEVALIYIDKRIDVKTLLFDGLSEVKENIDVSIEEGKHLKKTNKIASLIEDYNHTINSGMNLLKSYFREYRYVSNYIHLVSEQDRNQRYVYETGSIQEAMNDKVNKFIEDARKNYWNKALSLDEVKNKMTAKQLEIFREKISKQCIYDFNERNLKTFISNLVKTYEDILVDAVDEVFEMFTSRHSWKEYSKNVHYFDGWKTNQAFFVNKKVIIPIYGGYSDYGWNLKWEAVEKVDDIDKVMNYFSDDKEYTKISDAVEEAFKNGQNKNIESTYFKITCYKKGTMHLTFKSEDIRRRFNICAGKKRNWLPDGYGKKVYENMSTEEKKVVDSFEGKDYYNKSVGQEGFRLNTKQLLMLE